MSEVFLFCAAAAFEEHFYVFVKISNIRRNLLLCSVDFWGFLEQSFRSNPVSLLFDYFFAGAKKYQKYTGIFRLFCP